MKVREYISHLDDANARLEELVQYQATLMDIVLKRELESLVYELKATKGNIQLTVNNLNRVYEFSDKINSTLSSEYAETINNEIIETYKIITRLNNRYFSSIVEDYGVNSELINSLANLSFHSTVRALQAQIGQGISAQVVDSVKNSILSGQSYNQTIEGIKALLNTTTGESRLASYYKTVTNDAVYQFSRNYQETVTKDLGLNWFLYDGGVQETSRHFCAERHGKYYHREEVEYWGRTPKLWDAPKDSDHQGGGRHANTDSKTIFQYVGGYGCKHILVAVSDKIVPDSTKKRFEDFKNKRL